MRSALLSGLMVLCVLPAPALAAPKTPLILAKNGKWEINYDKYACHLFASFGSGKEEATIRLTRYQPGDTQTVNLYGQLFRAVQPFVSVEVTFPPHRPAKRDAAAGTIRKNIPLLILGKVRLDGAVPTKDGTMPAISPEQEAKVSSISLKVPGRRPVVLETGSFGAPMQAMRQCTDDLIQSWGYKPTDLATLQRGPEPLTSPETWLRSEDYPMGPLYSGENGIVQFRLEVDPAGSVSKCHVLYRTDPDGFADLTCKQITKRAKFKPALDQAGVPTTWFYINRALWKVG